MAPHRPRTRDSLARGGRRRFGCEPPSRNMIRFGLMSTGRKIRTRIRPSLLVIVVAVSLSGSTRAQPVADFYRGKSMTMLIGYTSGGGYDIYARVVSRHMARHIPGKPSIVPQNMPGAGSLRLANFLYNAASTDGMTIGMIGRG